MTKAAIAEFLADTAPWIELSQKIHAHPELSFEEHQAAAWITESLEGEGFSIERGLTPDTPTSFTATWGAGGPHLVFMAEYDALPKIGHGCGHNIIGAAAAAAAAALKHALQASDLPGTVSVVGTPAEELGGGKILLAEAGVFDDYDAALMVHPADKTMTFRGNRACVDMFVTFHGKSAHAAARPHLGINALDAVINSFVTVRQLMPYLDRSANVHGIITKGGEATNVIPDLCEASFLLRAESVEILEGIRQRVQNAIERSAESVGATTSIEYGLTYAEFKANRTMADLYGGNLRELGVPVAEDATEPAGSSDVGNVSRVLPTIHPYISIGDVIAHTVEFAEAAGSDAGMQAMIHSANALAMTAFDLVVSPETLEQTKEEFRAAMERTAQ